MTPGSFHPTQRAGSMTKRRQGFASTNKEPSSEFLQGQTRVAAARGLIASPHQGWEAQAICPFAIPGLTLCRDSLCSYGPARHPAGNSQTSRPLPAQRHRIPRAPRVNDATRGPRGAWVGALEAGMGETAGKPALQGSKERRTRGGPPEMKPAKPRRRVRLSLGLGYVRVRHIGFSSVVLKQGIKGSPAAVGMPGASDILSNAGTENLVCCCLS